MMLTRRSMLTGAAAMAGLAAGCGTSTKGASLTIGLSYIPNVQFAPFYVALERGMFSSRGLDVILRHHGAQEDLFGALIAGREQALCASSDEAVVASSGGSHTISTFATMYQRYPVCLIAAASVGAASVKDLTGMRIGLPGRFGSSWYGLLAAMSGAGMSESDVQVVEIGYTGVSALAGGHVDAIVGFLNNEPLQFAAQNVKASVLPVTDPAAPTLVGPGIMAMPGAMEPAVARSITDAVLEAERSIIADPNGALDVTAKHVPDMSAPAARASAKSVLEATIALWLVNGQPSLDTDAAQFFRMVDMLKASGIISERVDPAALVLSV